MLSRAGLFFSFITVVLLHALVLHTWEIKEENITVLPQKNISTTINLQQVVVKQSVVIEKMTEPPRVVKKKIVKKKIIKQPKPEPVREVVEVAEKREVVAEKVMAQPALVLPGSRIQELKSSYLQRVRSVIERHKKYPRFAKRLRHEGTVKIYFEIYKNGHIHHVRLLKGCRYQTLNKAALDLLHEIAQFEPIPDELGKSSLEIDLPIVYKIIKT